MYESLALLLSGIAEGAWVPTALIALAKSSIVLFAGLTVWLCLRRFSASTRHLVLLLTLAAALIVPVISSFLPEWEVATLGETLSGHTFSTFITNDIAGEVAVDADRHVLGGVTADPTRPANTTTPWHTWALIVWVAGAAFAVSRLMIGWLWTSSIIRTGAPASFETELARCTREARVDLSIRLVVSDCVSIPFVYGLFRPVIVMPVEAERWSSDRRKVVLMHELLHVKRHDVFAGLVANLAGAIYWFNPLVWIACRRLHIEREKACDDHVLATGARPSDYAHHLLEIARGIHLKRCPAAPAAVAMAHRNQMEGRLMALLDNSITHRRLRLRDLILTTVLTVALVLPVAAMTVGAEKEMQAPKQTSGAVAGSERDQVMKTITEFYSALEQQDFERMRKFVTSSELDDYLEQILSFSVTLSGDDLDKPGSYNLTRSLSKADKVVAEFDVTEMKQIGDEFHVSHTLTMEIHGSSSDDVWFADFDQFDMVLEKQAGVWKIAGQNGLSEVTLRIDDNELKADVSFGRNKN